MTEVVHVADAARDKEARHVVPLSGGKDSTALAIHMLERHGDLPLEFVFTDTGAELPETYDYFRRFEATFGVEVHRLTILDVMGVREKDGRTPFDFVLNEQYSGFLPNPSARWCTRLLKLVPFEWWIGEDRAYTYLGIRAEERRDGRDGTARAHRSAHALRRTKPVAISSKPNIIPVYPFKDEGMVLEDVSRILEESGLGWPGYYGWRSRSGCYFCFYQQIGEWQGLREEHPDLFEKAKSYEKVEGGRRYSWVDGRSLDQVEAMPRRDHPTGDDLDGCAVCHL